MMFNIWGEDSRPAELSEYVWADETMKTRVENWINDPSKLTHLIFAGSPGIGKTSLALLMCKALGLVEYESYKLFRVGRQNGTELIEDVSNFCASGFAPFKIIILDEADRLTTATQETLLRSVIDNFPHCCFILTCNNPAKLRNYVGSRVVQIDFKILDQDAYLTRLIEIAQFKGINLEHEETLAYLEEIGQRCYPDLRQAINQMQNASVGDKLIKPTLNALERPWHGVMMECIHKTNFSLLRETLQGLTRDELATGYRLVGDRTHIFGKNEKQALVAIAHAIDRHSRSEYPELTLMALVAELSEMIE